MAVKTKSEVWKYTPIGIRVQMIHRAEMQGNSRAKAIAAYSKKGLSADKKQGGMNWDDTPEGWEFWKKATDLCAKGTRREKIAWWRHNQELLSENLTQEIEI